MEPYESKWTDDTNRRFVMGNGPELIPLSDASDYEVADNEPDVRGWDVYGEHGEKIGEIDDLIVDPKAMKVRYLDVDAVDDLTTNDKSRHMLIPIGSANIHETEDKVIIRGVTKEQLEACPTYKGCPLTTEFANKVQATFISNNPGYANPNPSSDYNEHYYAHPLYDPHHFYEKRKK